MTVKRFSASSAAQLIACPGSADLERAIPGFEHPVVDPLARNAKSIGTDVHAVLEPVHAWSGFNRRDGQAAVADYSRMHITKRKALAADPVKMQDWLFGNQYNWVDENWIRKLGDFTPAMLRFISEAIGYMDALLNTVDQLNDVVRAEEKLIAEWLPSKPGTTPDVSITGKRRLEVVDYKSGAIEVSPVDNDQLLFYAACLRDRVPKATEFTLHIVQPGNMDSWTAPIEHLDRWMQLAREAEARILRGDLTLRPSKNCTFCPANPYSRGDKGAPSCPAQRALLFPPVMDLDEILQ